MQTDILLEEKYKFYNKLLNEKDRRIVLAAEAKSLGRGGFSKVSKLSGISRVTLNAGLKELASGLEDIPSKSKSRKSGGGRKKAIFKNELLQNKLADIVSPHTMGDPMKPLQWTSKSLRKISDELSKRGYTISHRLLIRA